MNFEYPQIRKVIMTFSPISRNLKQKFIRNVFELFTYHDIVYRMTLQSELTVLDPFTHTSKGRDKIFSVDFIRDKPEAITEKLRIEETYCTLVTVGGKFLEKKAFKQVLKKIDEIRKKIRKKI